MTTDSNATPAETQAVVAEIHASMTRLEARFETYLAEFQQRIGELAAGQTEDEKIAAVLTAIRRTFYGESMSDNALKVLATVAVRALTIKN